MTWKDSRGYVKVYHDGEERYEHRVVAEKELGRELKAGEVVHHINGDKSDNRWVNLNVVTQGEHQKVHSGCQIDDESERPTTIEKFRELMKREPESEPEEIGSKIGLDDRTARVWSDLIEI